MNMKPPITVMTSREFNQDRARAKRAARTGPVFITDRGDVAFVMMTKAEYDSMQQEHEPKPVPAKPKSLREALMMPRGDEIEFEPPRLELRLRPAEFD